MKTKFNEELDNTAQDLTPDFGRFGNLEHELRLAVSCNNGLTCKNPYLSDILAALSEAQKEHAALVAVTEAAQGYCENFFGKPTPNEKAMLKALANLAAVRNQ